MSVIILQPESLHPHGASNFDQYCAQNAPQTNRIRTKLTKTVHPDLTIFSNTLDFLGTVACRENFVDMRSAQTSGPRPHRYPER